MRRLRPSKRKLSMQGLQSADLFSQPVGPLFHAIATRGGNGENGCLGVQVGDMAVEQVLVEREHGQGVNLVQHDGGSRFNATKKITQLANKSAALRCSGVWAFGWSMLRLQPSWFCFYFLLVYYALPFCFSG